MSDPASAGHPEAPASPSSFRRNVATMMTGTVIAQAIPILISPILTRLYEPADYGVYATVLLVSYTISALATGRYESAVILPEREEDALDIVGLCFVTASIVALAFLVVTVALRFSGRDVLGLARLGRLAYLVPLLVLFQSWFATLNVWQLRQQSFRQLSTSRVFRAIAMAGANIVLGVLAMRSGLVVGALVGQAAATFVLIYEFIARHGATVRIFDWSRMRAQARRHKQFPLYALPADLLSTVSAQFPLLFFDLTGRGLFGFVQNVVNAPLSVVSAGVQDAFRERAARDYRERGDFRYIFTKMLRTLFLLSVVPMMVLAITGPDLFAFLFGESWRRGGEYARILTLMYFFKFIVSPLSYAYFIVERQKEDFILHVWVAISTLAALWIGMRVLHSDTAAILFFSINYALVYVVYLIRSYGFSKGARPA